MRSHSKLILGAALAAGLATLALASAGGVGCSGTTREGPSGPRSSAVGSAGAAIPPAALADAGRTAADAGAGEAAAAIPMTPRDCESPTAVIVNHPDGGVVFNNAMTSVDAGFIDRTQGVIDAIADQATAYRCCFDPWVRAHSDGETELLLRLTLAPEGEVVTAEVDAARSSAIDEAARNCVLAVARDTTYPPSPTHKETVVEYPFRVTAE